MFRHQQISAFCIPLILTIAPVSATSSVDVVLKVGAGTYLGPGLVCLVSVPEGSDAGEVLDAAVGSGCIESWDYETFPDYGRFVTCINEICGQNAGEMHEAVEDVDGTYWEFSVGLHTASHGIDGYEASPNEVVGFTFQDWYLSFVDFTVSETLP